MKEILEELADRYPFLSNLIQKAKTFTLPGFDGIPVLDVYQIFIAEIRANSLPTRSKAIAFSFFLAIFPALTFVFSLIPYIPYFNDLDGKILEFLRQILPNRETYNFISSFIQPLLQDLAQHKRGGLLTGSVFMVIFLTSNGVMAMMSSFDKSYDHYKKRNAIHGRLVALSAGNTGLSRIANRRKRFRALLQAACNSFARPSCRASSQGLTLSTY